MSHARNVALPQCRGEYITFCDADDFVSPQLISVLTRAVDALDEPDILVWRYFKAEPKDGLPVYDMDFSDVEIWNSEELSVKIVSDVTIGGFTWNKLLRRDIAQSIMFDESLKVCSDQCWILCILTEKTDIKAYLLNYSLYVYEQPQGEGQTRDTKRIYTPEGANRFIATYEKELAIENISPKVIEQIKGNIYASSVRSLYKRPVKFSPEVYQELRRNIKHYARTYYFRHKISPYQKLKDFIKHIIVIVRG